MLRKQRLLGFQAAGYKKRQQEGLHGRVRRPGEFVPLSEVHDFTWSRLLWREASKMTFIILCVLLGAFFAVGMYTLGWMDGRAGIDVIYVLLATVTTVRSQATNSLAPAQAALASATRPASRAARAQGCRPASGRLPREPFSPPPLSLPPLTAFPLSARASLLLLFRPAWCCGRWGTATNRRRAPRRGPRSSASSLSASFSSALASRSSPPTPSPRSRPARTSHANLLARVP